MVYCRMIPAFSTTGIGSLPHTDPAEACRVVIDSVDIPFWPQLPKKSHRELMIPQLLEGFPFAEIHGEDVWVVEASEELANSFYTNLESGEGFGMSSGYASGLEPFLSAVDSGPGRAVIKGHITGPLTFTLGLTDRSRRPIFFDDEKRELALQFLIRKAAWQTRLLKRHAEKVIIFVDEPILSALGTSAYLGVSDDEAGRMLREITDGARAAGAIVGIHCCSKAHWPLVVASGVDILNFDAFDYAESLALYPAEVRKFLDGGGRVAWGIVPTTDAIDNVDLEAVGRKLTAGLRIIESLGIDAALIRSRSLLTPSCGTGSLTVPQAEKVFRLLKEVKQNIGRFV